MEDNQDKYPDPIELLHLKIFPIDRLAEDEVIKSAMPDEMYKVFHWYKNDEWERFLGATTQWDLDTYLDCLP
ncbi:glutamine synthetase [Candidatus Pelagibacter sp.]|nr:glutamine synthetase [Candidatus Pelagibacter sp.]